MAIINVNDNYGKILPWLQENVGDLLHSNPLLFWHGDGWHMKRARRGNAPIKFYYEVTIDDEQKATWFTLVWA